MISDKSYTEFFETMLGTKLLITNTANLIIRKPHLCGDLLTCLKKVSISKKAEIIEKFIWIIDRLYSNGFILAEKLYCFLRNSYSKSTNIDKRDFIIELIEVLIENNRYTEFSELLLGFIEKLITKVGVQERYLTVIFLKLKKLREPSNYDGNIFLMLIKLLSVS